MKIYTKTGDKGETSLYGGKRVSKSHLRIEAIGAADELNAYLGTIISIDSPVKPWNDKKCLSRVQNELFTLGADLATPSDTNSKLKILRVTADMITWNGPISFSAGQVRTYTYSLVFTSTAAFTDNHLENTVTIQYDTPTTTDNTKSFTLSTIISSLPDTGLFDSPSGFILAGLALILAGILVNRSGILLNIFGRGNFQGKDATSGLVKSIIDDMSLVDSEEAFQKKVVKSRERKYRK